MTTATFYSWQGKPNEVPKLFTSYVDRKNVNLITETFPCLNLTIELADLLNANYCTFTYPGNTATGNSRKYYWFIDDIEKYENLYRYKLTMDVMCTYWTLIADEEQMIERSSNLTSNCFMRDALWKTGQNIKHQITFFTNPSPSLSPSMTGRHFALTCGRQPSDNWHYNDLADVGNIGSTTTYSLTRDELNKFSNLLWSTNVLELLSIWLTEPLNAVTSLKYFPFQIPLGTDTVDSENTDFKIGDILLDWTWNPVKRMINTVVQIDAGHISITRPYGDFRDYPPYTNYQIFLPYIGFIDFPLHEFYDKSTLYIRYNVSLSTGDALIVFTTDGSSQPVFVHTAKIGTDIPLTKTGMDSVAGQMAQIAIGAAITAAGAPMLGAGSMERTESVGERLHYDAKTVQSPSEMLMGLPGTQIERSLVGVDGAYERTTSASYNNPARAVYSYMRLGMTAANSLISPHPATTLGSVDNNLMRGLSQKCFLIKYTCEGVDDATQLEKYGRLVMKKNKLRYSIGFTKVSDPNLPMLGLPVDVYNAILGCLSDGYYHVEED